MHPGQLVLTAQDATRLITDQLPGTDPRTIRLLETSATTSFAPESVTASMSWLLASPEVNTFSLFAAGSS